MAASQSLDRFNFKFDVEARGWSKPMSKLMQCSLVLAVVEDSIAAKEDIEFQIVIRKMPVGCSEDTSFATTIAATEDNGFNFMRWDNSQNAASDRFANTGQLLFERLTTVYSKTPTHEGSRVSG